MYVGEGVAGGESGVLGEGAPSEGLIDVFDGGEMIIRVAIFSRRRRMSHLSNP